MINKLGAFFALFFLVGAVSAETIPATLQQIPQHTIGTATIENFTGANHSQDGIKFNSWGEACAAVVGVNSCEASDCFSTGGRCKKSGVYKTISKWEGIGCNQSETNVNNQCGSYVCPANQGWTLQGSNCVRADCPAYKSWVDGVCTCPAGKSDNGSACVTVCPSGYHVAVPDSGQCIANCVGMQFQSADGSCKCEAKSYTGVANYSQVSSGCVGGCSVGASVGLIDPVAGIKSLLGSQAINTVNGYYYIRQNGGTCSNTQYQNVTLNPIPQDTSKTGADGVTPDPKNTLDNNKSPDACSGAGGSFIVVNGASKCISDTANAMDKLTIKEKSTTTTNSDGSSSVVTETIQQVCDSSGSCTSKKITNSTNTAAGGGTSGSTSTETGAGAGSGAGGEQDSKGQCAKEPNSPMCRTGVIAAGGSFGSLSDDVAAAKAQYQSKFNEVKTGIASLVLANFSGGVGALPCRAPITVLGSSLEMCFTKYESSLLVVGQFVVLLGALASLFILFGRR